MTSLQDLQLFLMHHVLLTAAHRLWLCLRMCSEWKRLSSQRLMHIRQRRVWLTALEGKEIFAEEGLVRKTSCRLQPGLRLLPLLQFQSWQENLMEVRCGFPI